MDPRITARNIEIQKSVLQDINSAIRDLQEARDEATMVYSQPVDLNKGLVLRAGELNKRAYNKLCNVQVPPHDTFAIITHCTLEYEDNVAADRARLFLESANRHMRSAYLMESHARTKNNIFTFTQHINAALIDLNKAIPQVEILSTTKDLTQDHNLILKIVTESIDKINKIMLDTRNFFILTRQRGRRFFIQPEVLDPIIVQLRIANSLLCNQTILGAEYEKKRVDVICNSNWPNQVAFNRLKSYMLEAWRDINIARTRGDSYGIFMSTLQFTVRNLENALPYIRVLKT